MDRTDYAADQTDRPVSCNLFRLDKPFPDALESDGPGLDVLRLMQSINPPVMLETQENVRIGRWLDQPAFNLSFYALNGQFGGPCGSKTVLEKSNRLLLLCTSSTGKVLQQPAPGPLAVFVARDL